MFQKHLRFTSDIKSETFLKTQNIMHKLLCKFLLYKSDYADMIHDQTYTFCFLKKTWIYSI